MKRQQASLARACFEVCTMLTWERQFHSWVIQFEWVSRGETVKQLYYWNVHCILPPPQRETFDEKICECLSTINTTSGCWSTDANSWGQIQIALSVLFINCPIFGSQQWQASHQSSSTSEPTRMAAFLYRAHLPNGITHELLWQWKLVHYSTLVLVFSPPQQYTLF